MSEKKQRQITGEVISTGKMDKTIVVQVTRKFAHPIYKKYITKTKKYYAHDPLNKCKPGDLVKLAESRPISKLKRWRVV